MSKEIAQQVDVGSLTLNSLSAFNTVLSAISADDITPGSLIQLSALGSHFHVSGQHAAQIPDLLQRTASTRLDRLGIVIGWKKGDAASYMAHSAGGQAVSLLCLCLQNIQSQNSDKTGEILYDICERILPRDQSIASIRQLGDAAKLLSNKLAPIGFGNVIASMAFKILSVYEKLQKPAPDDLFDSLTREGLVEFLTAVGRVFDEEDCQLRVTGTRATAFLLAIVKILFPKDLTLTVEELIIHQGPGQGIIFNIVHHDDDPSGTRVEVEHKIRQSSSQILPLGFELKKAAGLHCTFAYRWHGHIRHALETSFHSVGLLCPESLIVACCDEVLHILQLPKKGSPRGRCEIPRAGLMALLGTDPLTRMFSTFQTLLHCAPSDAFPDEPSAFAHLVASFEKAIHGRACTCDGRHHCDRASGWTNALRAQKKVSRRCVPRFLWLVIGQAIYHTVCCMFVDACDGTMIYFRRDTPSMLENFDWSRKDGEFNESLWGRCEHAFKEMFGYLVAHASSGLCLASSNEMSTLFPSILTELCMNHDYGFHFKLVDGQIIMKHQYYRGIVSTNTPGRRRHKPSKQPPDDLLVPSSAGEHVDVHFAVLENADSLTLRTAVVMQGRSININMHDIVVGSMGAVLSTACDHHAGARLKPPLLDKVCTTTVAEPLAPRGKMAIVQTKGNAQAQLLACCEETNALVQRDCCLHCAVREAMKMKLQQVVVACDE